MAALAPARDYRNVGTDCCIAAKSARPAVQRADKRAGEASRLGRSAPVAGRPPPSNAGVFQ